MLSFPRIEYLSTGSAIVLGKLSARAKLVYVTIKKS